jgi:hypothetical protein
VRKPIRFSKLRELSERQLANARGRGRMRFTNPMFPGYADVVDQPVYDDASLAAATAFPNQITYFQTGAGQGGKTQFDSYLQGQSNGLPNPQKLFLRAYRFIIQPDANPTDGINVLFKTWLNFVIGLKPYFFGPTFLWTGGVGVSLFGAQVGTAPAGAGTLSAINNGLPDSRSLFSLSKPFMIEQGDVFNVTQSIGSAFNTVAAASVPAGTGLKMYCMLDGQLYRGVQ